MKQLLVIVLCFLVLAVPAFADAPGPLTMDDVELIVHGEYETVQDYIDAFAPTEYSWYYEGEATNTTVFTLGATLGGISLAVADAKKYQNDEEGFIGADALKGDVLEKPAELVGVYWEGAGFDKLPLPRGIKLGDSKEKLQATIGNMAYGSLEPGEYEENYDETASYTITLEADGAEGWKQYYAFDFFLSEGKIAQVQMQYYTDAE